MPLPDTLARFNRHVSNPLLKHLARRAPLMATVIHRGRTSGNRYETPVLAFLQGSTVTIAMFYGVDVDWRKNVMAAGGCRLIHRNRYRDFTDPHMIDPEVGSRRVPLPIRLALRLLRVDGYLEMTGESREQDAERDDYPTT